MSAPIRNDGSSNAALVAQLGEFTSVKPRGIGVGASATVKTSEEPKAPEEGVFKTYFLNQASVADLAAVQDRRMALSELCARNGLTPAQARAQMAAFFSAPASKFSTGPAGRPLPFAGPTPFDAEVRQHRLAALFNPGRHLEGMRSVIEDQLR